MIGALASALALGPILMAVNQSGSVYVPVAQSNEFPLSGRFPIPARAIRDERRAAEAGNADGRRRPALDTNSYFVVHKTTTENGPAGRYLVDEQGAPVYLVDPGINGVYDKVPGTNAKRPEVQRARRPR